MTEAMIAQYRAARRIAATLLPLAAIVWGSILAAVVMFWLSVAFGILTIIGAVS